MVRKRKIGVQAGRSLFSVTHKGTQCGETKASYSREDRPKILTYDELRDKYLWDKGYALKWLKDEGLIASEKFCSV